MERVRNLVTALPLQQAGRLLDDGHRSLRIPFTMCKNRSSAKEARSGRSGFPTDTPGCTMATETGSGPGRARGFLWPGRSHPAPMLCNPLVFQVWFPVPHRSSCGLRRYFDRYHGWFPVSGSRTQYIGNSAYICSYDPRGTV